MHQLPKENLVVLWVPVIVGLVVLWVPVIVGTKYEFDYLKGEDS